MYISQQSLETLGSKLLKVKDTISKVYLPNSWLAFHYLINTIMNQTAKEADYQNMLRVYKLLPRQFIETPKEDKVTIVKIKLSCEWECFVRTYKLLEEYTEQELEKVFDVFFAWYVFDMWYTQHRDMYMYVQDKKKVDKVLPSQVSSLGKTHLRKVNYNE